MSRSPYSVEERLSFIDECYKSGLSVHSWCDAKGIAAGTFYSWMHHLKKSGYRLPENVPAKFREKPYAESHDIVRVEIIDDETISDRSIPAAPMQPPPHPIPLSDTIKVRFGDVCIEVPDGTNPSFLSQVIKSVRYSL